MACHDNEQAIDWDRLPDAPHVLIQVLQYDVQLRCILLGYLSLPGQFLFRRQGFLRSCCSYLFWWGTPVEGTGWKTICSTDFRCFPLTVRVWLA